MSEAAKTFDAAKYKQVAHDQWNHDSSAWHRWSPTLHAWFAPTTDLMLDLAEIRPGQRVLDVACGAGEPAVSAAERVGIRGTVVATDLSEKMLQFAEKAAKERGLRNFETRVMDGESLVIADNGFDVVLCRLGLMLMANRQQALSEWLRVLKPGGRASVAVFSAPERTPWMSLMGEIIRQKAHHSPPAPGQPGIFAMGAEGVLEKALRDAGFKAVEVHPISVPLHMASTHELVQMVRSPSGALTT